MPTESSTPKKFKRGVIYEVNLDQLYRDVDQPRKHFDEAELESLKQSIADKGLLYPIIFRVDNNDCNIIVSGERRFKAFQALGKEKIPAMLVSSDKFDEVALIDNILRSELHPVDEAEALENLRTKHNYTHDELGNLIGKAANTVTEIVTLARLSQEIRDDARTRKNLSRNALLKVARKPTDKGRKKAYEILLASLSKVDTKRPYVKSPSYKKTVDISDKAIKAIQTIDLGSLGDNKSEVETKLMELLEAIRNKLDSTGS
ncbi:nucleoid occlusion protein [Geomonas silvestris]|uniref:Nucleoid occlusion protein n=1 Tax=Geomonas silvestris TaxID=2740184 RepID=A0A6V8MGW1_9BACT|nr:ParB/RepB/Spo0J family partition protein [Geomonas silvestris]GFO59226.1 nucleoid occlusion protein [Geomonas silvestris]